MGPVSCRRYRKSRVACFDLVHPQTWARRGPADLFGTGSRWSAGKVASSRQGTAEPTSVPSRSPCPCRTGRPTRSAGSRRRGRDRALDLVGGGSRDSPRTRRCVPLARRRYPSRRDRAAKAMIIASLPVVVAGSTTIGNPKTRRNAHRGAVRASGITTRQAAISGNSQTRPGADRGWRGPHKHGQQPHHFSASSVLSSAVGGCAVCLTCWAAATRERPG